MQAALRMLARRDHGCVELAGKLRRHGYMDCDIQWVTAECIRLRYLDDAAFADGYVRRLQLRGYGCRRIRQMLLEKGLPGGLVEEKIEVCCRQETQRQDCLRVMLKKARGHQIFESLDKSKTKLFRFLLNRGFSPAVINDVLSNDLNRRG